MAAQLLYLNSSLPIAYASALCNQYSPSTLQIRLFFKPAPSTWLEDLVAGQSRIQCSAKPIQTLRTCKNCKTQFNPSLNDPRACCYHTAHFGVATCPKIEGNRSIKLFCTVCINPPRRISCCHSGRLGYSLHNYDVCHCSGETKRKFEGVHSGGTMNTPDSGKVVQYWHCCGSEDPFDPGCTAAPHSSYDD